jgi:TM2 domain-containing membrane protein YozV
MKRFLLVLTIVLSASFTFAQTSLQDVVYLKNGSIIRGDIIEMVPSETVKIMTADGCVFIYDFADVEKFTKEKPMYYGRTTIDKKSPWAAGIMSYFIPGLGQFYNGEERKGWIDLGTQVGGYAATLAGLGLTMEYSGYDDYYYGEDGTMIYEYKEGNKFLSTTGVVLFTAGIITIYANAIHSIVDAVKSSKRINAENGYVMYQINDRCAFGMQPSIAYERPQYLQGSKPELSAGMKFKLTF